jgi:predicted Zn-dependent peptidase
MNFHQETLPNGLTILAETSARALSTGLGFFVKTGARDETPDVAGVSHFLEHMAFKGNDRYSADDVNRRFDEIGAKYNAYTTEEHTVYHAVVLPEFVGIATDMLADLLRPALRADDFFMEKKVIIEEIGMYADMPPFVAYEKAMARHFGVHPLGNSVLGSVQSIEALAPEKMRAYHDRRYSADNVIVAGAGKIDWRQFRDAVEAKCGGWKKSGVATKAPLPYAPGANEIIPVERYEQQCVLMLAPAPGAASPLRVAGDLLATILGDDTGSRLHWALAEPGKVESIDFGFHEYYGAGIYMLSAACSPDMMAENLAEIRGVLQAATKDGVTAEELELAKNKVAARLVLSAEKPRNRLGPLAYSWAYRESYHTVVGELEELRAVTLGQIRALLEEYPLLPATTVLVGPLAEVAGVAAP